MEGEQFSLCWNNFHNNLSSGFNSLFREEDLVDVTLAAEGRFLKAHKTVLSVCSPFFKELFRANPSQHPIVILPDVNYTSLRSLLQFMYQGEVSVHQDEIPTFMRVAELLKVKGLTDGSSGNRLKHDMVSSVPPPPTPQAPCNNNSSSNNGYNLEPPPPPPPPPHSLLMSKRPRPLKKMLKPIHHLRPLMPPPPPLGSSGGGGSAPSTPPLPFSSSSPVGMPQMHPIGGVKRPASGRGSDTHGSPQLAGGLHVKNEPMDSNSSADNNSGHSSPSESSGKGVAADGGGSGASSTAATVSTPPAHNWGSSFDSVKRAYDLDTMEPGAPIAFSAPLGFSPSAAAVAAAAINCTTAICGGVGGGGGGLTLLKSGRGQLVLVHNGHIYTHSEALDNNQRHLWVCVKKKTLNCDGCLTTANGPILLSYTGHNHSQLHEVIQRLQVPSCSISPELF